MSVHISIIIVNYFAKLRMNSNYIMTRLYGIIDYKLGSVYGKRQHKFFPVYAQMS